MTVDKCDGAALVGAAELRSFYGAEGYPPIGNFNGNPAATFFGEKRLSR